MFFPFPFPITPIPYRHSDYQKPKKKEEPEKGFLPNFMIDPDKLLARYTDCTVHGHSCEYVEIYPFYIKYQVKDYPHLYISNQAYNITVLPKKGLES